MINERNQIAQMLRSFVSGSIGPYDLDDFTSATNEDELIENVQIEAANITKGSPGMISLLSVLLGVGCSPVASVSEQALVLETIRSSLRDSLAAGDSTIRVQIAGIDLNGDGRHEAIAYVSGNTVCGSGGCNLYVLKKRGKTYQIISDLTTSWPPVKVLGEKQHGWRSLSVWVQGGGILPGYKAILRFNGNTYPDNPTMAPKAPADTKDDIVLFSKPYEGLPLFSGSQ